MRKKTVRESSEKRGSQELNLELLVLVLLLGRVVELDVEELHGYEFSGWNLSREEDCSPRL